MRRRPNIAVVTPFYVDRDAVCNDVFHFVYVLRQAGWETRSFAIGRERSDDAAAPLADLPNFITQASDIVIYHFSTGSPECLSALAKLPGKKVLKYHNITPPEMFSIWSDVLAEASRVGRVEIAAIAAMNWDLILADSEFNYSELVPYLKSMRNHAVLPPFHEVESLLSRAAVHSIPALPLRSTLNVLFVGRVAPSKGHGLLLRVIRYAHHELALSLRVRLIGKSDHRFRSYEVMLRAMIREYGLEGVVTLDGSVTADSLADAYSTSDVFLCTSDHEGFCVPLVEAMAFGKPIVALATSAVPETVGDAGLVFETRDPRPFALALERLQKDPELRQRLSNAGRARNERLFAMPVLTKQLLEQISKLSGTEPIPG
jgi:glycosyltransferase involved in cell wall biosynthesis